MTADLAVGMPGCPPALAFRRTGAELSAETLATRAPELHIRQQRMRSMTLCCWIVDRSHDHSPSSFLALGAILSPRLDLGTQCTLYCIHSSKLISCQQRLCETLTMW